MIEDIQKVNKLAQELLDQGIATTRDEAVEKAQQFLNKEITTEQKVTSSNKVQVAELTLENLKNIFDRHKDLTQQKLADFRSAINALAEEIKEIKKQLSKTKPEARTAQEAGLEPEKKTGQIKLKPKEEKKEESHPKRGKWKSEDVAIDKIFYYGNK